MLRRSPAASLIAPYEHCGWLLCGDLHDYPPFLRPKNVNLSLKPFLSVVIPLDWTLCRLCLDPPERMIF